MIYKIQERASINGMKTIIILLHIRLNSTTNLVPRACDPWEGNEGSGIIRFREESDWPLK